MLSLLSRQKTELETLSDLNTDHKVMFISERPILKIQSKVDLEHLVDQGDDIVFQTRSGECAYSELFSKVEDINVKEDPHIGVALVNLTTGIPMTIASWFSKVKVQTFKAPELIYGDIMVAAKYDGEIKGMRIIKKID